MWGKRRVEGIYAKLEEMSQKRLFFALYPKKRACFAAWTVLRAFSVCMPRGEEGEEEEEEEDR